MINSSADAGIPLLTEILVSPPVDLALVGTGVEAATDADSDAIDSSAAALSVPSRSLGDLPAAEQVDISAIALLVTPAATLPASVAPATHTDLQEFNVDFDIPELHFPASASSSTSITPATYTPVTFATPVAPSTSIPSHTVSADEWEQLEADITERISRQVLSRIDFVLEQRVRDSLADVLQTAVEGLAQEIKRGLHSTLEDVIARAVAQEIARLQTSKS